MSGVEPPTTKRLDQRRARGLTLWSVMALLLSPFSIPTFGVSGALAAGLVIVASLLQWRGLDARRPLAAGIIALCLNGLSAGACSWLVLRTAEVTGFEAVRQEAVEDRFDQVFKDATRAPTGGPAGVTVDGGVTGGDAGPVVDADSPAQPTAVPEEPR